MQKIRVGLNGLGRIGRTVLREWYARNIQEFDIVAVNNLGKREVYAHLLRYDSVHGRCPHEVKLEGDKLIYGNKTIAFTAEADPAKIPWDVDLVIDATGVFKDGPGLRKHMKGSTKKVMMCAPGKELDGTFVMGVNHKNYDSSKHHIVSNASCTTNCLAPVVKVLQEKWGIENGMMTTIHSYTLDQKVLDAEHSDLRRARAAAVSMIPTSTGAAKAIGQVIPELKGKLDGYAIRVPTPNVSVVDFTANLKKPATKEEINAAMKAAAEGELKDILAYVEEELVSIDFMSTRVSSSFDASLTNVIGNTIKVVAWYDNEAGYSNRVIDLAAYMGSKL